MNITFDIKCVKHFQVGVCPDEDNAGGAGSACTAPSAAAGFSFSPDTSVPGLSVTTNFSQICNEITMSFNAMMPVVPSFSVNPLSLGTINLPTAISTLLSFYTGAFYVNGTTPTPSTVSGVGSINLNSSTGIVTLYTDAAFIGQLDANTSVTVVGSIIFYVL